MRAKKKRGKASKKDLAQQAAAAAASRSVDGQLSEQLASSVASTTNAVVESPASASDRGNLRRTTSSSVSGSESSSQKAAEIRKQMKAHRARSLGSTFDFQDQLAGSGGSRDQQSLLDNVSSPTSSHLNSYTSTSNYHRPAIPQENMIAESSVYPAQNVAYSSLPYPIQTPPQYNGATQLRSPALYALGQSPISAFAMTPPGQGPSPRWMNLPSPMSQQASHDWTYRSRYPVLQPLIPHLDKILPVSLACDLLDLYFASSSSAQLHPMSPYVLGYVFRKRSMLHPTKPRQCTPALLASILWVAAQTSEASFLTSPPSSRGEVCQRLLELTVGFLKPLIHGPASNTTSDLTRQSNDSTISSNGINRVALGGLGVTMSGTINMESARGETGGFGASSLLDDVVTYIHLATVVSASEYKGASLRWWNAAWSLARELKLGRELPFSSADNTADDGLTNTISEEHREERRRIWWLVYTVDRHLSLCYNKPLFLLDAECEGLLQPMDDTIWQAGEFYTGDSSLHITSPTGSPVVRKRGPNIECVGHSIFGYFTPLMTILGEIVDLYHAKNHPRFGALFRSMQEFSDHERQISEQLEAYGRSLDTFAHKHLHNEGADCLHDTTSRLKAESDFQTRIVVAYGTHVMHVLHILLTGKWDPISLLDDNDLWISSQQFVHATGHAVSAAEAISQILEFDPGLEFMPFFFGVYLLQGSFLLLLIADKLQTEASPDVVKACEIIVRAHEACVVTLNTEYQVCHILCPLCCDDEG